MLISVVIPFYNTSSCVKPLYERLLASLAFCNGEFEIICVDDNSPQEDYVQIDKIAQFDHRVKLIKLSKNFGQQAAISCGLHASRGDWVVVMDADLQDRPEEIVNLYEQSQEGYSIVFTRVTQRNDSILKRLFSASFHFLFAFLTGSKAGYSIRNYGIYERNVIDAFLLLEEQFRGFALLVRWLGFRSTTIEIQHDKREIGKSSYNFSKGLNLAIDAWLTFSDKPLRLTISLGFFVSALSIIAGLIILVRGLMGFRVVLGWTSLILSIWFLSGFTVFCVGLIGLYVGKVFNETKKRPHYIIDSKVNIDE